jgi:hypothetical protein
MTTISDLKLHGIAAYKLYEHIASTLTAYNNCIAADNNVWRDKYEDNLHTFDSMLPHGSGLDSKTELIIDESTPDKLVFSSDYHHMDEMGGYDGWTEHKIIVTPSFHGINIHITGRDRDDIKDYLADTWQIALTTRYYFDRVSDCWLEVTD